MKTKTYKIEDLRGKMFGFLEVLDEVEQRNGNRYVLCKCHRCGREKEIYLSSLTRGITTSCGCGHRTNLVGKRFGNLVVIDYAKPRNGKTFWACKCDCGTVKEIEADALVRGKVVTCGCWNKKKGKENRSYKHGLTNSRIMGIWAKMKVRCYNSKEKAYKNYGARGIRICDEWLNDVSAFWEWSKKNGYADNLTIDRIDVNGNYEPSNCRWVDRKTQCNNQRNNHYIDYKGEHLTLSQIEEKYSINQHRLACRLLAGWDVKTAIETPVMKRGKRK